MPKVSVIVPVYNVEPYLKECMESIVRQTLKDIEIICVNDGSTDGSLKILKEYAEKDERIILIDKENGGYGLAMNIGLDRATGEYIGIVEPDDYVALTMYEDLYNTAAENDLDLVKADFYRFYTEDDRMIHIAAHLSADPQDYGTVFRPTDRISSFFYVMNNWAGIYRLSFLQENRIRHNETPGASFQDNGFWFQTFMYAGRAMIVDKPYYRVRRDNPNSSTRSVSKVYAMNIEYDYIRGLIMRNPEMWEKLKGVYWRKRYHNYYATMQRIAPEFIPEYRQQVAKELKHGYGRGEFGPDDFREGEWKLVTDMMEGRELKIPKENLTPEELAKAELALVMNSGSFRIGRAVTWLPRKARNLARKVAGR